MGVWAIHPQFARLHLDHIKSGMVTAGEPEYIKSDLVDGIQVIQLNGPLMKAASKFGGTSYIEARQEIAKANRNPDVNGIALYVDSPGGNANGVLELYRDVRDSEKEIRAYADYAASAGFWSIAGASSITVGDMNLVGSIGAYMVLEDVSGAMDEAGVKAYLISSGGVKGHGADGKVTPELLAEAQKIVDFSDSFFAAAVREGRGLSEEEEQELHTGQMFTPEEALAAGLIDGIDSFDSWLTTFANDVRPKSRDRQNAVDSRMSRYRG